MQRVVNARAAVMHVFPKLQYKLLRSTAAIKGHSAEKRAKYHRVYPWIVVLAFTNYFSKKISKELVRILQAWDCYLRPGEIEALKYR